MAADVEPYAIVAGNPARIMEIHKSGWRVQGDRIDTTVQPRVNGEILAAAVGDSGKRLFTYTCNTTQQLRRALAAGVAGVAGVGSSIPYCASKAALSMYLDIARMELSRKGIGVTTILPGFVETEIMEDIGKYPFAVSAEKAAREMADIIERGAAVGVVPAFPWKYVKPFFKVIPDAVYRKLK